MNDMGIKPDYIQAYTGTDDIHRKKTRFSVSAFLLSFLWFFRRKMYREFAVTLAAVIIFPLLIGGIAGISRMERDITPQAVYSELRRVPVEVYHEYEICIYGRIDVEYILANIPWYEYMTLPVTTDIFKLGINSEPAFYFNLFRVMTLFLINLYCGIFGEYLHMRHIRRNVIYQLGCIRSDNEDSRIDILKKAGKEYREQRPALFSVTVFFILFTVLPVFNDAVCIMYGL